ncbi:MAG: hypothetical protein U1F42_02965 [Candidatus Competibacteraceae bacterium]
MTVNSYQTTAQPSAATLPERTLLERSRRKARLSAWAVWIVALLLVLPLATYWNTTFHHFGFRDDYSNLSEAHEEPGKIIHFIASHARPVYGVLLEYSFGRINSIHELEWLRLAGAFGLGLVTVLLFGLLRWLGWNLAAAAFTAATVSLTPAAQVVASWATAWPYTVATLFSLSGFALADNASEHGKRLHWAGAMLLVAVGALTYQPSSLFYLVGVVASLPRRREQPLGQNLRWVGTHLIIVFAGLAVAFFMMKMLYLADVFEASARITFERDPVGKFLWFVREPLLNALNIFVLNDDDAATWRAYAASAWITALLLAAGLGVEWWRRGRQTGGFWLILLLALPPAAYSVNLVVADRYASYRTVFALTGVLLVFLTLSWANLCSLAGRKGRFIELSGYAVALALAIYTARIHAYALIAVPQSGELQIIQNAADHVTLQAHQLIKIYFVQPSLSDSPAEIAYHDEFGSLSTNNDWLPKEIFDEFMRERFPTMFDREQCYEMQTGFGPPPKDKKFDVVIDMRKLRKFSSLYTGLYVEKASPHALSQPHASP